MSSAFQNSLLVILNDMMGRDVDVTLKDGVKYTGILAACSPELSVGLHLAFKLTERNRQNLLPYKDDVVDKIIFNFQDVVEVCAPVSEPKTGIQAMNFATDRDYHARNGPAPSNQEERLEEWTGEDDEGLESNDEPDANRNHELPDQRNRNAAGWSVEEMFAANKEKVVSTFKDDLTQYTTVAVEGTEEDRARADRLAREIEQNTSSKFYARLENDDVERDLDKETGEDDFELVGNRRGKGNYKQNQGSSRQSSNGVNMNNSMNRRADALKGTDRRNSGGSGQQQQQQQRYSGGPQGAQYSQQSQGKQQYNNGRNKNEESFDNKGKGNYPQKQMLESRSNTINKPSEEERRAGKNSIISSLKNFGNEFELKDSSSSSSSASNAAGAWNSGPPKSLLSKNGAAENSSVVQSPPSTSNESNSAEQQQPQHQRNRRESGEASTSEDSAQKSKGQQQQQNNQQLNDSGENSSSNESNTMTPSTADNSDASSNAGVPKSSSSSTFKFNINAPEFVPTMKPTTPQPGTPTNQFPPHFQQQQQQPSQIAPQQFVQQAQQPQQPHDYQQQQAQGAHMMQGQPIVGGPHMAANGQPVMVWQQPQQPQQYPGQYQYVQIQHPMQRGPAQGAMYNGGNQQQRGGPQQPQQAQQAQQQAQQQQRMFVQQWQQPVIVPQPIGYFQPQQAAAAAAAAAAQYNPQQAQQQQQPPHLINGPPPPQGYGPQQGGGRGAYPQQQQQQMYMMQQQQQQQQQGQQRYPQQGAPHDFNAAGAQGGPQSHPNSQPTTPGPQQGAAVPSPGQSVTGGGLRQGPESGSQGSLAGSANGSHTRSGSPQPPATAPSSIPENRGPPLMNMPPPPPQQLQYMHVAPPMHPQLHQGQQPYYPQQIYYPQGVMYQQHGMAMQQGPPGVGPHQAQMMGGPIDQQPPQHMMDNQGMQAMQQPQHPFVVDQYSAYQNGPTYYQQPHGAAMSRQNSVPHQYPGANQGGGNGSRDAQGAGGSQSGAPSQNA